MMHPMSARAGLALFASIGAVARADTVSIDVELRMLTLDRPSAVTVTTAPDALPGQADTFDVAQPFVLELWVSDVGALNSGVVGLYLDLTYDGSVVLVDGLQHTPGEFQLLLEGSVDNGAGAVTNFGGSTLDGAGVEPAWARLGYLEMSGAGSGGTEVVSSLGLGGVGVFARSPPSVEEIQLDMAMVTIVPEPSYGIMPAVALLLPALRRLGRSRPIFLPRTTGQP